MQRIEGFKVAQNDIVVQLDDDIILENFFCYDRQRLSWPQSRVLSSK